MKLKRGSTSVRRKIFIADSSSTVGAGLTGLVYNSASLVCYYIADDLSNEVAVTLATATLGTWASGGFVEVDATNMPGWYEIGIPNAALDGGIDCAIQLRGATNMVPVNIYIELDAFDYQTATQPVNVTQFGGTNGTFNSGVPTVELDPAARVKLDASQPDYTPATAANLALAKAILDKIDTGLVVDGAVYQFTANMLELGPAGSGGSSDWTADERTAIRSILGIPGSGTTPANPTTGILDTIRDLVVAYIAAALATVDGSSGTIVDFPASLNIGDSYTDEANASIHVFIRDASDDPITAVGSFNFTDPEFAPEVNITQSGSTGRVKAVVTFIEASPEDYLKVEIPSSQSRRASPGTATIQCLLKWVDTDGKVLAQKTLSKQAVTWNEMV